jgi:hypothetical protein
VSNLKYDQFSNTIDKPNGRLLFSASHLLKKCTVIVGQTFKLYCFILVLNHGTFLRQSQMATFWSTRIVFTNPIYLLDDSDTKKLCLCCAAKIALPHSTTNY